MLATQFTLLIGILIFNWWLRSRFRNQPLDWDHGVYGYLNYWYQKEGRNIIPVHGKSDSLISWGKPGLTYLMWLIVKLCGTNPRKIRDFDSAYYLLNTLGVFWLGKVAFSVEVGLVAAGIYAFYSSVPFTWTADENPENYQTLFITLSTAAFIQYVRTGSDLWLAFSGVTAFLTMLLKQNSMVYFAGFGYLQLFMLNDYTGFLLFSGSVTVPYLLLFGFYMSKGHSLKTLLGNFLIYPSLHSLSYIMNLTRENGNWVKYKEDLSMLAQLKINLSAYMKESSPLWLAGLLGLAYIGFNDSGYINIIFLSLFSGIILGYLLPRKFFPNYFIPFTPVLAIAASYWMVERATLNFGAADGYVTASASVALLGLCALSISPLYAYFFKSTPSEQALYQYKHSLPNFLASEEIAEHIKENTSPEDMIFVWCYNPEIYFLSERRSAVGHLLFNHGTTRTIIDLSLEEIYLKMMDDLVLNEAKYVVLLADGMSTELIKKLTGLEYETDKRFNTRLGVDDSRAYTTFKLKSSSFVPALSKMGEKDYNSGNNSRALEIFKKLTGIEPSNAEYKVSLATVLWAEDEKEQARDQLDKALSLDPENKDAIISFAEMAEDESDRIMAISYFENYLTAEGYDSEIEVYLSEFKNELKVEIE